MAATKRHRIGLTVLFLIYLAVMIYFLFFSERFGRTGSMGENREYRYNLVLFQEVTRFADYRTNPYLGFGDFFINIIGNILAFMPLGFFIPALGRMRKNGFLVVLCCFSISLLVEVIQLVYRLGCFDVDDLFLNTLGGLLGYLVYRFIHWLAGMKSKRKG
jgi:glycopeptide antibiotics resistance protein